MSSPRGEGVLSFLGNVIVEARINCRIDCYPRHTSSPEVLQSESNAIFEVVSRIEDESMPNHEDIYVSVSKKPSRFREAAYPRVATYSQSSSVPAPFS